MKVCKANFEEASDVMSKYGVNSLPTICIFKKGQVVNKTSGVRTKENITKDIEQAISS